MVEFELAGQRLAAMNGGPRYTRSPATSIILYLETQAKVDRIWSALPAGGGAESRCGWLTDKFGLSWQILLGALQRLLQSDPTGRALQAMMSMIKIDIAALEVAARG